MASIKITVTMTDNSVMEVNAAIEDADVGRLLTAMAKKYDKPVDQGADWLIRKWTEEVIFGALSYTQSLEQAAAAQAAASQIQMIPVTIN